jgi:transposase-like protein
MTPDQRKAQQRARIILQVRSGQLTAKEGARQLGISRKTYYQWEKRALRGMLGALEDQPPGRPAKTRDQQRAALEAKIQTLEGQLKIAQQTAKIRSLLIEMQREKKADSKKKKRPSGKSSP